MKTQTNSSPRLLSDSELLARVKDLAGRERQATACLVAHLAELEERRLHVAEGCASIFTYCTEVLHLSEHAAYNRIEAARAARKFPRVIEKLADGSVHLSAIRLLAPHLRPENHRELLDEATHKTTRQVEEIVARLRPRDRVPTSVRRLAGRRAGGATAPVQVAKGGAPSLELPVIRPGADEASSAVPIDIQSISAQNAGGEGDNITPAGMPAATPPPRRAKVEPLAPDLYQVRFTADAETHRLLCQARELLRHQIPDGDAARVIGLALKLLVRKLARQKFAARTRAVNSEMTPAAERQDSAAAAPHTGGDRNTRHIPAAVRREVWKRDQGRCAYVARNGRRCAERGRLEFHHVKPFALGGRATLGNIQLRCRAHNQYEAEICFGPFAIARTKTQPGELVLKRVENVMVQLSP